VDTDDPLELIFSKLLGGIIDGPDFTKTVVIEVRQSHLSFLLTELG